MFTFMALGYTGGLLSLVMQRQPILESPHFWSGTALLGLLAINGLVAFSGFGGNKDSLRITHAYLGLLTVPHNLAKSVRINNYVTGIQDRTETE